MGVLDGMGIGFRLHIEDNNWSTGFSIANQVTLDHGRR